MAASTLRKPLTTVQESRLIRHLDPSLLDLSGAFESRHSSSSQCPTLTSFLDTLPSLLRLILSIPAAKPSGGLRTAYLLQLTGYLGPAVEGYPLNDESLDKLFETVEEFDKGWETVLQGREHVKMDSKVMESGEGTTFEVQPLRNTDVVRLKSLIQDLRQVLSSSLNLPEMVPLALNPFEQEIGVDVRRRFGEGEEARIEQTPELSMGEDEGITDDDDSMSVDTLQATADDDEDSDAEFEAVEIVSPLPSRHLPLSANSVEDSYTTPSSDPEDSPRAFEIHFEGLPPPTLTDGEIQLNSGATPITGQRRGFDPDEEYPLDDEEETEDAGVGEDGADERKAIRERVEKVFERTEETLRQSEESRAAVE
ncbi:hypothetical protein JCM5353_006351 [Sporobolomyces roseus]